MRDPIGAMMMPSDNTTYAETLILGKRSIDVCWDKTKYDETPSDLARGRKLSAVNLSGIGSPRPLRMDAIPTFRVMLGPMMKASDCLSGRTARTSQKLPITRI